MLVPSWLIERKPLLFGPRGAESPDRALRHNLRG
jgi:hypothetical protein